MKTRPQGASVVPKVATATSTASRVSGMPGTTRPLRGGTQVGRARKPETTRRRRRCQRQQDVSTRWKTPAGRAAKHRSQPAERLHSGSRCPVARIRPRDAGELGGERTEVGDHQSGSAKRRCGRRNDPGRGRAGLSVTMPMRAPSSWKTINATVETASTHSRRSRTWRRGSSTS